MRNTLVDISDPNRMESQGKLHQVSSFIDKNYESPTLSEI